MTSGLFSSITGSFTSWNSAPDESTAQACDSVGTFPFQTIHTKTVSLILLNLILASSSSRQFMAVVELMWCHISIFQNGQDWRLGFKLEYRLSLMSVFQMSHVPERVFHVYISCVTCPWVSIPCLYFICHMSLRGYSNKKHDWMQS